ncbi:hypothetical protein [Streptomyces sp. NPDC048142]
MTAIAVEITTPSQATDDEFEIVENLDEVSSTDVMLGCGEDNPF